MNFDFYDIFYYSCLLISAAIGLACLNKVERGFKWLAILMVLTVVSELIAKYLVYGLEKQDNNIVYHFFTPVEYAFYVIIFLQFLEDKKWHWRLWLSAIALFLFEILNTMYIQPLNVTSTNVIIAESVLLVFLSLVFFLKIRETPSQRILLREGVFWFNSAVLCYYAFSILVWGFHNMKVYNLDNAPQIIYDINMILSGLLYLSFSIAIVFNALSKPLMRNTHD